MFYTIDNAGKVHVHQRFMAALIKCQVRGHRMCDAKGNFKKT